MKNKNSPKDPLIAFEEGGRAAVLQYNLPTSSTYQGIRLVDLTIDHDCFTEGAKSKPPSSENEGPSIVWDPPPSITPLPERFLERENELKATGDADDAKLADKWHELYNDTVDKQKGVIEGEIAAKEAMDSMLQKARDLTVIVEAGPIVEEALQEAEAWMTANLQNTGLWIDGYSEMMTSTMSPQDTAFQPMLFARRTKTEKTEIRSNDQTSFTAEDVVNLARSNIRVVPVKLQSGRTIGKLVQEPREAYPRIVLVEYYCLSSYLGDYGAGKTLNTFTLLPGEESTITIRTWKQITATVIQSSSILDSYEDSVAEKFEKNVQDEHSNKRQRSESEGWNVETSAKASWGFGSASVKAGARGTYDSSREDFSRNVHNALSEHAAKASHQRKLEINSSTERRVEEGEESLVTRILKNINLSRVMNFVFRELNQEFISYLHLVDLRVAFVNDFSKSTRVYTLSELDKLLDWAIIEEHRDEIRNSIIEAYSSVLDFRDEYRAFIELKELQEGDFWRVRRGALSEDPDLAEGQEFDKQTLGIIIKKMINILPTDAIVVDALLGEGVALDQYALDSQQETLKAKQAENALSLSEADKIRLALKLIQRKDEERAKLFILLFPPPESKDEEKEEEGGPDNE